MSPRYAIYYMPNLDSAFWRLGSACLGYDAASGADLIFPAHRLFDDQNLASRVTQDPRKYGFHATLKAPFSLKSEVTEADFLDSAQTFAREQASFELPKLSVQAMDDFIAFKPRTRSTPLHALADACVLRFEPVRKPLDEADIERRLAQGLSERQSKALALHGYPFVFDDFHFHMTLTGKLDAELREIWLGGLTEIFSVLSQPVICDSIAVFKQGQPGSRFHVLTRLHFGR